MPRFVYRPPAHECGDKEIPGGYRCGLARRHRGEHRAVNRTTGDVFASWIKHPDGRLESWFGPTVHYAAGSERRTACGVSLVRTAREPVVTSGEWPRVWCAACRRARSRVTRAGRARNAR